MLVVEGFRVLGAEVESIKASGHGRDGLGRQLVCLLATGLFSCFHGRFGGVVCDRE